jgi:hypothetical protein
MPKKNVIPVVILLTALFILYGDTLAFLPKPIRDASLTSRKFVVGLWPSWVKPKDVNKQRDREIEQLQKTPSSSQ